MDYVSSRRHKLERKLRRGGLALILAWSLIAIAIFGAKVALAERLLNVSAGGGWVGWTGNFLAQSAAPTILIVWLAGVCAIAMLWAVMKRTLSLR
ncbi:hypothetical protein RHAB21_00537 [Pseudorhizobium halotolerans]|uniref:Uncharacterized protein n=1 Tax=Pseudorhizobium halotolerans TaxID=1233081 RepID=A0ABN7JYH1_9HYPH|nr:hypothetical protein [Pseudorhizobium halotolerans]CAD7054394.1 hypothetical protein RHAB21_00537 [Pseudorhizobium halotolerans]